MFKQQCTARSCLALITQVENIYQASVRSFEQHATVTSHGISKSSGIPSSGQPFTMALPLYWAYKNILSVKQTLKRCRGIYAVTSSSRNFCGVYLVGYSHLAKTAPDPSPMTLVVCLELVNCTRLQADLDNTQSQFKKENSSLE